jgi:hypothetical protein
MKKMKSILKKYGSLCLLLVLFSTASIKLQSADDEISGGVLDKKVNSDHEDYGAYLLLGKDTDTLFFTSSRPTDKRRKIAITAEMFFSTRPAKDRNSKDIHEGWSSAKQIIADDSKIAEFSRGALTFNADKTKIVFAAERDLTNDKARGSSYLFDLYEMHTSIHGFTNPKPISEINEADYWDSQPALSPDGKILYFVSNREGGSGGLDIWYSYQDFRGQWNKPKPVPNINTAGDEYSPHCGADGYFYFSSNWDYVNNKIGETGKDIYRADYNKDRSLLLPFNPILLDDAIALDAKKYNTVLPTNLKYNSDKDDEFPYITDDRKYIFLTSNRSEGPDKRNLFAYSLPKSRIRLQVNISEKILDANGIVIKESTDKKGLALTLVDKESKNTKEITSGSPYEVDADKEFQIQFSKFVEEECYSNKIEGPSDLTIKTFRPFGKDTLYIENVLITRQKVEIPPIVFNSTDTLPYFITGYWYPNTSENVAEFREREANGFFNKTGFVDSTGYRYDDITARIDQSFSSKIYQPLEEILPAFQDFCRDTLYLKITIHGYTDPRGLSGGEEHPYRPQSKNQRSYPDETISIGLDERGQEVTIPSGINMWNFNWPLDPNNKEGRWIKLSNDGEKGNILLSKLRAYFTFVTFDKAMSKRSPIYENIKNNGRIIVDAEGCGIDKEGFKSRNLRDDPQSRRIEIYLDILRPEELSYHKRMPGGTLKIVKETSKHSTPVQTAKTETAVTFENQQVVTTDEGQKQETEVAIEYKLVPNEPLEEYKEKEITADFETEEKYSDKDEISQKYKKIEIKETAKTIIPEKENEITNQNTEVERICYKIYYQSYDNADEAIKAQKILRAAGVAEVRVVEMLDNLGTNKTYELYSGCFLDTQTALEAMKEVSWATKTLNLSRKPVIIK